jgi:hypothetical protein
LPIGSTTLLMNLSFLASSTATRTTPCESPPPLCVTMPLTTSGFSVRISSRTSASRAAQNT